MDVSLYQERFWLEWQLDPTSPKYNEVLAYEVEGALDIVSLNKAISRLLKKHILLRSRFFRDNGNLQVAASEAASFVVDCVCIDGLAEDDQLNIAKCEAYKAFDLTSFPLWRVNLFKVGEACYWLVFSFHHIILDGNAFSIFLQDFSSYYNLFVAKNFDSPDPAADTALFNYQTQCERVAQGSGEQRSLDYYIGAINQDNFHFEFQKNHQQPSIVHFNLERTTLLSLNAICTALKSTPFRVMTALFSIFLYKAFEKKQFCLTYPVNMRVDTAESLLGSFINLQLIPISINASTETFKSLLSQISLARHHAKISNLPYEKLIEVLRQKCHITQEGLPNVIVSQTNLKKDGLLLRDVSVSSLYLDKTTLPYDISFEFEVNKSALYCKLSVNNHYFQENFYQESLKQQFQCLLNSLANNIDASISELLILPKSSVKNLVDFSCCKDEIAFSRETIYQAFCRLVHDYKESIAVIDGGNKITYQNLLNKVDHVAANLQVLLDDSIEMVGVTMVHGVNLLAMMLALFKVGKCYLPIRPDLPAAYIEEIVAQSDLEVVIIDETAVNPLAKISYLDANALMLEDFSSCSYVYNIKVNPTAYVLFTSGTTGVPKGVVVSHQSVVNLILSCQSFYNIGPGDVVAWFHSYAFDFSVWEIWAALLNGATVYVMSEEARKSPEIYTQEIIDNQVTILNKTPSSLKQWAICLSKNGKHNCKLGAVRLLIMGGEALYRDHINLLFKSHFLENCKIFNMYGITEDCVHSTIFAVTAHNTYSRQSIIGKLLPGKKGIVVSQSHQPKAVGQVGEFLVSGYGVATGYFQQPALTKQRFVELVDYPGIKWLKTGDKVRLLPSGNFEYIGRTDSQIKIRGYRLDYKDVEVRLSHIAGVHNVKVIFDEENLLAFLSLDDEVAIDFIIAKAKEHLPTYMIPNYFFVIDAIPCNANNKVDIATLLKIASSNKKEYVAQLSSESTNVMAEMTQVWQSVLSYHDFDITDNFFDCGGNSLLLLDLQLEIEKRFSVMLPILEFFKYTTIKDMAKMVEAYL